MKLPTKQIAAAGVDRKAVESVLRFVRGRYEFIWTNDRCADYVFHSGDGYDVLRYSGVRIFITGENVSPNFNLCDYAMAFDKMTFGDRYLWLPLLKNAGPAYQALTAPRPPVEEIVRQKTDFCAYVMSNTTKSADERTRIFDLLSQYKPVNSGGRWRNNVGGRVADKLAFQAKHKFVIAFENCSYPGYLTEKFAQAAQAQAVPIYWGDPTIGELLNPKAFINCHDFATLEEAVEQIKKIDQDDALYRQMLAEPWFCDGVEPPCLRDETIAAFFCNIFDQPHEKAFRRNRGRWGRRTERHLYDMYFNPHIQAFRQFRKGWRAFWRLFLPPRKKY